MRYVYSFIPHEYSGREVLVMAVNPAPPRSQICQENPPITHIRKYLVSISPRSRPLSPKMHDSDLSDCNDEHLPVWDAPFSLSQHAGALKLVLVAGPVAPNAACGACSRVSLIALKQLFGNLRSVSQVVERSGK